MEANPEALPESLERHVLLYPVHYLHGQGYKLDSLTDLFAKLYM